MPGPSVHPSAFVAPGAVLVGDVTLEENTSVWYGAVLRADINRIRIGPGSNIQDGSIVHLADDFGVVAGRICDLRAPGDPARLHGRRRSA